MNLFRQIFFILLFYVFGEILSALVLAIFPSVYLPGTILGLGLLLVALSTKILPKKEVESVGTFLTSNMAFFFIPAAVGVIEYFDILSAQILKILALILISTILSFLAIVASVKLTLGILRKREGGTSE
ncbi:MAG: CidA/LrgA family protein [Candidatus Izemoplasmatales bacterium]|nr:CidA/LrgA family protein [Candidatus Izemoplasmatales bacterium]